MKYKLYKIIFLIVIFTITAGCHNQYISNKVDVSVPFYPESTVKSKVSYNKGFQVILETAEKNKAILDYYTMNLRPEGWQILKQRDNFIAFSRSNEGVMIDIESPDSSKRVVTICYLAEINVN